MTQAEKLRLAKGQDTSERELLDLIEKTSGFFVLKSAIAHRVDLTRDLVEALLLDETLEGVKKNEIKKILQANQSVVDLLGTSEEIDKIVDGIGNKVDGVLESTDN